MNQISLNKIVKLLLIFTVFFSTKVFSQAFKQVKFPLNNKTGIPYEVIEEDYYLDGFEIDKNGSFYFMGGYKTKLIEIVNNKIKIIKQYDAFKPSQLYLQHDILYVFDFYSKHNNLYAINKKTGSIIQKIKKINSLQVNSFSFLEDHLILEFFPTQYNKNQSPIPDYYLYSLSGKLISKVNNAFNLPTNLVNEDEEYLGIWNGYYVFWNFSFDDNKQGIILKNKKGQLISSKQYEDKVFGESYYSNPPHHRKLRNNQVYILGYKGKEALITILNLEELFNKK